ncbi:hypothetical protein QMK17_20010 [Rhodococcus sp. G-MC3]|uniref:hypothetical protein n=1 Tax=Rhodococcus sp. G-MC3 TaxID=3046209 RepID=UPI0024B8E645|nr:hypothetical protein [Rhodococcus sp. G-MC3]MDJ0395609.1 hypothetical protein [Rhodococcus sp. G-MC3]
MRVAVGVHVSTNNVTASLVDTTLPELGPIASRTVAVATTPGGIGGAVATALGFMRVQALQNGLHVVGAAVVCENALQREIVADTLAESEATPVVDIFDDRLSDVHAPDVSAALLVGQTEVVAAPAPIRAEHRGIWPVAAVGACVLAALGGVTAWAMTAETVPTSEKPPSVEITVPTTMPGSSSPVRTSIAVTPGEPAPEYLDPELVPDVGQVVVEPSVPEIASPAESTQAERLRPPARPSRSTPPPTRTAEPSPSDGGNGGGSVPSEPETPTSTTSTPSATSTTETPPAAPVDPVG